MSKNVIKIIIIVVAIALVYFFTRTNPINNNLKAEEESVIISGEFDKSKFKPDEEWKKILTPQEYHIVREQGTEIPYTGSLLDNKEKGTYVSVGCNQPVFSSTDKYDSGTGWPSFTSPINEDAIVLREDVSFGQKRVEVLDKCGGHLGHVFDDGPQPTGNRYCINSLALKFIPDK